MRSLLLSAIALGALGLSCNAALAKKVSISGTHSAGQISSTCAKIGGAGGTFSQTSNGYQCVNQNNGILVSCNNKGKCSGDIPRSGRSPHTLGGILYQPSGNKLSNTGTSPRRGMHPVKVGALKPPSANIQQHGGTHSPPQPIMRASEHNSSIRRH